MLIGPEAARRRRDGFALTDPRAGVRDRLSEIHYCVLCHERDKDSCSKGITDKQGAVVTNPLGIALAGCPLDEKISEMHLLRKRGDAIGSLALVMIDNPMCPGTGHRICNDCMKACIYQKQDPVDIPQVETGTLTDVLQLPWGVEIYGLLTRWNPLNVARPYALPYNGRNVLVVGLGPAGYTLSHYLVNEGFGVVAIDGLKIEPPDPRAGRRPGAAARADRPLVRHLPSRSTSACSRASAASPSTASRCAGTRTSCRSSTSRWPGGRHCASTAASASAGHCRSTRSGRHGIHHVAIAAGAGRPTIIDIKNNLIRGIRKASDFLMALQLTGAFKADALSNLQVRLPGGGDWRRAHRHRHGHRTARLLPAAGREAPRPARGAGRRHR